MIIYGLKRGKYLALDTKAVEELVKGKSLKDVLKDLKKRYLTSHNKWTSVLDFLPALFSSFEIWQPDKNPYLG